MVLTSISDDQIALELAQRGGFGHFHEYVWGRPLHHHELEWSQILLRPGDDVIVSPPGTWKTTLVRRVASYLIAFEPEMSNLYIMNTATQAENNTDAIRQTIEYDQRYQAVAQGLRPVRPDKERGWSRGTLFIKRQRMDDANPTLFGAGLDGPYQGMHPEHIFVDDPTDQQDIYSQTTMQQQRNRLTGVLYDRLERGIDCQANGTKVILTRWAEDDLVPTFEQLGFKIHTYPIEGDYQWGRLLFPERYPDDVLQRIKRDKQTPDGDPLIGDLYHMTYMCSPQGAVGGLVKRQWWRYYKDRPQNLTGHIYSWDLATGRKGGDYTAWLYMAVGEDGYYILDGGHDRLTEGEMHRKMQLFHSQNHPQYHIVEDASISIPMIQAAQRATRLPIRPEKAGTFNKSFRLRGVTHLIETGRVWLPVGTTWVRELLDEVSVVTDKSTGKHDDYVYALSQGLKYLELHEVSGLGGHGSYIEE